MATFQLYRMSSIGTCLIDTLDEMVENGTLSPELALLVLLQFDKSMVDALENQVKSKVSVKGHLYTYRFCDDVWTFIIKDVILKYVKRPVKMRWLKIVACDSKVIEQA